MRDAFHSRLDRLIDHLAHMCDLAAGAMRQATTALLTTTWPWPRR